MSAAEIGLSAFFMLSMGMNLMWWVLHKQTMQAMREGICVNRQLDAEIDRLLVERLHP